MALSLAVLRWVLVVVVCRCVASGVGHAVGSFVAVGVLWYSAVGGFVL